MSIVALPHLRSENQLPFLSELLRSMVRIGQLTIIDARGRVHNFGDHRTGPSVTLRLQDRTLLLRLLLNPSLAFGEAYMDGSRKRFAA